MAVATAVVVATAVAVAAAVAVATVVPVETPVVVVTAVVLGTAIMVVTAVAAVMALVAATAAKGEGWVGGGGDDRRFRAPLPSHTPGAVRASRTVSIVTARAGAAFPAVPPTAASPPRATATAGFLRIYIRFQAMFSRICDVIPDIQKC